MMRPDEFTVLRLRSPHHLDLADGKARKATVHFLSEIRDNSRRKGIALHLDFSALTKINPAGAVLLVAQVFRAVAEPRTGGPVTCTRPTTALTDAVLNHISVYQMLGIACETPSSSDESVRHWRQATGVMSDGTSGGSILSEYEGRLAEGLTRGLYAGIVEAMTNTVHHAYQGHLGAQRGYALGRRWWMLSQEKEGRLTVALCDLGIGIPKSLPQSSSFERGAVKLLWRALRLDRSDSSAIRVAIQLGESRTGEQSRGKGLSEIVSATQKTTGGDVAILSNRGAFTSGAHGPRAGNHATSIGGTLIYWSVPIEAPSAADSAAAA